tara:strand:- start:1937 stop:2455 length:519 start_codon:yes stop_codon:yes gene_type:complete
MIFRDLDINNKYEIDFVAKVHTILAISNFDGYKTKPEDLKESHLWKTTLDSLNKKLKNSKIDLVIDKNNIVGVQWIEIINSDELRSHMVWVREEYRGKDLMGKLRKLLIEWGIRKNMKYITSAIEKDNISAQKGQLGLGFVFQNEQLREDGTYLVYKKELKQSGSSVGRAED